MAQIQAVIVPVTPFQQNCSLIFDKASKRGAVVDPGGDVDAILDAIRESGITVEKILLTHGHIDHAGGAAELREKLGVPIEGPHREDLFLLEALQEAGAGYGMMDARPVTPDRWLAEGDTVSVGDLQFSVHETPGHTPGSISVILDSGDAIIGDVIMGGYAGGAIRPTKPNFHYFADDLPLAMTSLDHILARVSGRLYVGHGGPLQHRAVMRWREGCLA